MRALKDAHNNSDYTTAIGYRALYSNDDTNYNTAVGSGSLTWNETGAYNTAVGATTGGMNTSGSNNTAIGYHAMGAGGLAVPTNMGDNVCVGYKSRRRRHRRF